MAHHDALNYLQARCRAEHFCLDSDILTDSHSWMGSSLADDQPAQRRIDDLLASWHRADKLSANLLSSAQKQIEPGHEVYRRVYALAERRFTEQTNAEDQLT